MRREMRQISGVNRPLGVALSEKAHETRFKEDLKEMYRMYGIGEEEDE